jgi:hypothetical protein
MTPYEYAPDTPVGKSRTSIKISGKGKSVAGMTSV